MAETGENYTTARRAVLAEHEALEVAALDRPQSEEDQEVMTAELSDE
jgi:hypothetical protein